MRVSHTTPEVGRTEGQVEDDTLLTPQEISKKLGVHVNHVYQLFREEDPVKRIPSALIGKRRKVRAKDFATWLATQFTV